MRAMKDKPVFYRARDGRVMECTKYKRTRIVANHEPVRWRALCPYCGTSQDIPAPSSADAMTATCERCGARLDPKRWAVRAHAPDYAAPV